MKSNTEVNDLPVLEDKLCFELVGENWEKVAEAIKVDLEVSARECGALLRRREIDSAANLLRLILFAALSNWGLRLVGAWAAIQGIGYLSDVAVLKRLRNSHHWLRVLISQILKQRCQFVKTRTVVRLLLIDATVSCHPGSKGTEWRTHLALNLNPMCVDQVEVTDAHGGETLARFSISAGDIVVADRGYAFVSGMGPILEAGGNLVVRMNWQNLPLLTPEGKCFDLMRWLEQQTTPTEKLVLIKTHQGTFLLRLCISPLPPAEAEKARRRIRKAAAKKNRVPAQNSLLAAGYVLLLTNLPAHSWSLGQVLAIYRLRWQVELQFKRYKSLLQFDGLRAKDPDLAQTYLLAKLLAILLLDGLMHQVQTLQPDWFSSVDRPVSLWRLTIVLWKALEDLICGSFSLSRFFRALPRLQRYLCDPPRARLQQLAWGRAFIEHANLCPHFFS